MPTTMEALALRPLSVEDSQRAMALSAEAGWNQIEADWRLMLGLGGGIGASVGSALVGTAMTVPVAPGLSWIGMLLVTATWRRRGVGSRLIAEAMASLRGAAGGLDASVYGRPVYLPLGFRDVLAISRHVLSDPPHGEVPPLGVALRPMGETDLAEVGRLDREAFGFERPAVLAHLRGRVPQAAWVAERDGRLVGAVMARNGRTAAQLGPLVAEDEETARALASRALRVLGGRVYIDAPDHQAGFTGWLRAQGALPQRGFTRMLLGAAPAPGRQSAQYAIAGPDLG